uniref:F-box domain-containing protein n=1 Tax=Globodera rostochiensis TaxID=31243 RepID=A0A914HJ25_GLORO
MIFGGPAGAAASTSAAEAVHGHAPHIFDQLRVRLDRSGSNLVKPNAVNAVRHVDYDGSIQKTLVMTIPMLLYNFNMSDPRQKTLVMTIPMLLYNFNMSDPRQKTLVMTIPMLLYNFNILIRNCPQELLKGFIKNGRHGQLHSQPSSSAWATTAKRVCCLLSMKRCQPSQNPPSFNLQKHQNAMQTSKSTSASAKCQQQLQLPRELIYELILCVPSTDWHARRVLLTCSFIYQTILNSKKTQNWKQPVPIMQLPLLPRIHGVSLLTFSQQIVPNMARYFNIIDGTIRSFYCIIKLDHALFPPGQSQSRLRLSLHSAITAHNFLGPTVEVFYLSNPVESEYDVLRLNFPVELPLEYIGGILIVALYKLGEAMFMAARGEFMHLLPF